MSSKFEELCRLREEMNLEVSGLENYPKEGISIIVANHLRLTDIFYLSAAVPILTGTVISSRSVFEKNEDKQSILNKYLYQLPLEVRGTEYSNMGINQIIKLMCNGVSINIFPEGAYFDKKMAVYRGRTGMVRILFGVRDNNIKVNLVPAAISIEDQSGDLNNYRISSDRVKITFLPPIDYEDEYERYKNSTSVDKSNKYYHLVTDKVLLEISNYLRIPYIDEYIKLQQRDSIYFPDGTKVLCTDINNREYFLKYENEFNQYFMTLQEEINKEKIRVNKI